MRLVTASTFALGDRIDGYTSPVSEVADLHSGVIVSFGPATIRFFRYGDTAPEITSRRAA